MYVIKSSTDDTLASRIDERLQGLKNGWNDTNSYPYFHIWCQLNPQPGVYTQETLAPDVLWCTPNTLKLHSNMGLNL